METYTVKNDFLTFKVASHGAEIISIKDIDNNELIWQADPEVWNRHAPILFPIVGRLNDDHYFYNDVRYEMGQHGFARDKEFTLESQTDTKLVLNLEGDEDTLKMYPFHFKLQVVYQLIKDTVQISYIVENTDADEKMYFSVGAHPGFAVPFTQGLNYEDFEVNIEPAQPRSRIALNNANIELSKEQRVDDPDFELTHEAFKDDAIIYSLSEPSVVSIKSDKINRQIKLDTGNAKFVGIWSQYPKAGNFVCIEPWWGIADKIDTDHQLENKYGINTLDPHKQFEAYYSISFK